MILILRGLAHLVAFVLLVVLALTGLAVAVFSIGAGAEGLSLPSLAGLLRLPELEGLVASALGGVEGGMFQSEALLIGAAAVLAGLLLLLGVLRRPAEGVMVLADDRGRLAVRRRPLAQAVAALAETAPGVAAARVRVKPRRRGLGGRIEIAALHSRRAEPREVEQRVSESLRGLVDDSRRIRVRARPETGGRGARAE